MFESEIHAPFWDHVDELRTVILRCLCIIGVSSILCFFFCEHVFAFLTSPYTKSQQMKEEASGLKRLSLQRERIINSSYDSIYYNLPQGAIPSLSTSHGIQLINQERFLIEAQGFLDVDLPVKSNLVLLGPLEGIIVALKTSLWLGIAGSSPFWLLLILRFVAPALRDKERRLIVPFFALSLLFLLLGLLFAFYLTLPIANLYLHAFNQELGTNLWSFSSYIQYTLSLLLANAVAFECSLVLLFLVHLQVFSAVTLAGKRRHFAVFAFIIAALLTPPDVLTQFLLAIPLIILYEIAILYARFRAKRPEPTRLTGQNIGR